jgi:cytochrome d ubiquinol oxidase subunit II
METLWFVLVTFMLAMYVILDGFDLGAGIIHLYAARSDNERRLILNAIGPVWDGNEVWILAAGGTLYFAFPQVYASSFSGFYLPLIIVLWLLILRGLGIEFRHHVHNPLWSRFWDGTFSLASSLLAIFLGAALGNVIRGVPLDEQGYFFTPLWTTFAVSPDAGVLDWYTVIFGLIGFFTLAVHGGTYISMKTTGEVQRRAQLATTIGWWGTLLFSVIGVIATLLIRPELMENFSHIPLGLILPISGFLGLMGVKYYHSRGLETRSFVSSTIFILGMLGGTAFALYPNLLTSLTDPALSLNVHNTAAQPYGLTVGLVWWIIGVALALGYFVYLYRSFRGKTTLPDDGSGY